MKNVSKPTCVVLMLCLLQNLQARNIDDDLLLQYEFEIKQRAHEIREFLLPMPDEMFDGILGQLARKYIPVQAVSEECLNHSSYLLDGFLRGDIWALKMVDAGSKMVSGVLDGHIQDLGNYRQCIHTEEPNRMFTGQHCVVEASGILPPEIANNIVQNRYPYFNMDVIFALCVPSSCSVEDVATHVDRSLAKLNASTVDTADKAAGKQIVELGRITCSTSQARPFRPKDYLTMTVFTLLLVAVVACTLCEHHYGSHAVLSSLSLKRNFKILMDTSTSGSEITCLSGLRVFFTIVVMAGHRMIIHLQYPTFRYKTILEAFGTVTMDMYEMMPLSVDGFFLLGSTVLSYNFCRSRQRGLAFNPLQFIIHRYLRITPLLAVVMLYSATLYAHLSRGPVSSKSVWLLELPCTYYWWSGLLHISNYVNPDITCVPQSWYLACDFQLYLVSPLFLFSLYKWPRLGLILLATVSLASISTSTVNAYFNEFYSGVLIPYFKPNRNFETLHAINYKGTHFRASPYLVGIALGYLLFIAKQDKDVKNFLSQGGWCVGWVVCVGTAVGLFALNHIVVHPDHQFLPWLDPLYIGLSKPVFSISVAWLIFACALGQGGMVNELLSWPGFKPLARLSFGVYLVHVLVISKQVFTMEQTMAFSYIDLVFLGCGDMVISFTVAALAFLTVEMPCAQLAAVLLSGKKKRDDCGNTNKLSDFKPSKKHF